MKVVQQFAVVVLITIAPVASWGMSPRLDRAAGYLWGIEVVDGDTIKCHGLSLRLKGVDAPEIGNHAKCNAERALGQKAKLRLRELVAARDAMPRHTSTRGGFGRGITKITVEGEEVGSILIREGLARPSTGKRWASPWCGTPIDLRPISI